MNYMLTTNFIQQFDEVQEAFCSGVRGFFISLCHLTRGVTKWHSPRIRKASPGRSLPQLEGLINMPCKPQRFRVWIPGARLEKSSLVKSRNLCLYWGSATCCPGKCCKRRLTMRVFRDILRSWSPASSATNLPAKESHTITISEATPRASLSQDSIEIKIQVDTIDISPRTGPCRIHDPFSRDDHEECDWYFQCLREEDYNEDRADKIVPAVKGYGGRLMSGLKWPEHTFKHPNIIIDVLQGRENGNDRTNNASIYHIHWEQLEQVQKQHWPGLAQTADPLEVHVRRVLEHPPVQRARKVRQDKEINVLLVIARRLQPKSSKEDLSPAMVYRSIVKVKKLLRNEHSHYNLNLEVVRPGTYEALVDHLARKNIEHGGTGFFQLIHFDLHGEVSKKGEQ